MKDWLPLLFLLLCIASFSSDTYNIVYFFNNGDVVFASLTLFCLLVPGYFGKSHLLENKEFFQQSSSGLSFYKAKNAKTKTASVSETGLNEYETTKEEFETKKLQTRRLKATFLYVFCIVTFPIFNIIFRATRLFRETSASNYEFGLGMDQVKSLFEDSPQLALQLYISFKREARTGQILAIVWSSLTVARPNMESLVNIIGSKIDLNLFSMKRKTKEDGGGFQEDWESRKQSLKSLAQMFAFFFVFVLISFIRAASFAIICCFLSYNALLVYAATFIALKILFELAKVTVESETLSKISKEGLGDIIANAFNILELKKDSFVIRLYAVFWMIFNVATIGSILFHSQSAEIDFIISFDQYDTVSTNDTIPMNLWIAPTFQLTDWSEISIMKDNTHAPLLSSLCLLNILCCILIFTVTNSINRSKELKKKAPRLEYNDVMKKSVRELRTGTKVKVSAEKAKEIKEIWAPYDNSEHFELVQNKHESTGLSTMTLLMDPWDFVSDYANQVLAKRGEEKIEHFQYEDAQQLLLKIMDIFGRFMNDEDPTMIEVFNRCRTQYDFLESLKQERLVEKLQEVEEFKDRFEELEETEEKPMQIVLPYRSKDKARKHQEVTLQITSEKDNNIQVSSLKKSLAEKEKELTLQRLKMKALDKDLSTMSTEVTRLKSSLTAAEKTVAENAAIGKEKDRLLSSLKKSLAEKEEEFNAQTHKIVALEEELTAMKTKLIGLKPSPSAPVVPFKPKPYKPIYELLEVLKAICLHMRIIGLGVRDIKKNFRIIEVGEEGWVWVEKEEEEEAKQKKEFGSLFKVLRKQIAEYGKATVPDIEGVVRNVKTVFVDYVDYVFENKTDEAELMETLDELKSDVRRFKTEADKVTKKQEGDMKALANTEVKVVESLGKFNDVTDRYKREMETLEKNSEHETLSKKILAAWKLISLGISIEVTREESQQSSLEKSNLLRKAEFIRKRNEVRENIAITTKAVIIPSFKKYILCIRSLAKFVSVLLEDLDKVNSKEADVKEFFDRLQLGSADVKETCNLFLAAMSDVRTDLGVLN